MWVTLPCFAACIECSTRTASRRYRSTRCPCRSKSSTLSSEGTSASSSSRQGRWQPPQPARWCCISSGWPPLPVLSLPSCPYGLSLPLPSSMTTGGGCTTHPRCCSVSLTRGPRVSCALRTQGQRSRPSPRGAAQACAASPPRLCCCLSLPLPLTRRSCLHRRCLLWVMGC